jgi:tetratricopeptide (TPR) repeat protein
MKISAVLFLLILFSLTTVAQTTQPTPRNSKRQTSTKNPALEKEEFDKAVAVVDLAERIAALRKFVEDFPKSKEIIRASEFMTSARAALADEKMRAGEKEKGVELFNLAVRETPKPVSDKLFNEVVLQIPNSLFFRGERAAAIEIARVIEEKAEGNAKQLLATAMFYIGMENVSEAKRLADKAMQIDAMLPAVYQTLGLAHRLDFQFEESVAAYQKALELDANSTVSKRSLAEMKRATGKASEAIALYREILTKDAADGASQTGLILALFDAENKTEAESELAKSLEANPNNLFLLVGAAYWYAAREQGAKAIEYAEKAVAVEPRYTWAHIALARGLMQQKRPFEAEKALLAARQYGDFPTLDYELASVRLSAGFYREAAEDLQKKFFIKDGSITTQLGGRVISEAKSFTELLAAERRASIFQTLAADNSEIAERLKTLLDFSQKLETSNDEAAITAANEFVKGEDKMKLHRQLFAAARLLEKKKSAAKILELTRAAVSKVDTGLDVPNAAAAVLADELYESRRLANSLNQIVIVPEVPRQTLSNIVRGRIEDITGWALFQDSKPAEAVTRLKRAVSVLPEKSSWWRTSMWRLGTAQESAGNSKDALDALIKSYTNGEPDEIRYGIIESIYIKVNGNTDGLEAKIGVKPASNASNNPVQNTPRTIEQPATTIQPATEPKTATSPTLIVQEAPQVSNQETPAKTELAPTSELKIEPTRVDKTNIETRQPETVKNQPSEAAPKPLFEPIIINVPKVEPLKKPETETKPQDKPAESETPKPETKTVETNPKPANDTIESRPRLVTEKESETIPQCKIVIKQENVSISSNGGNLSLLVRLEGDADAKEIKAVSSSPADVEVTLEPEFGGQTNRTFFTLRSISQKTGAFTVTFESVCGKKEVFVNVR